ncbi:hypothetical protein ES703_109192 [subsurface metagenome]
MDVAAGKVSQVVVGEVPTLGVAQRVALVEGKAVDRVGGQDGKANYKG